MFRGENRVMRIHFTFGSLNSRGGIQLNVAQIEVRRGWDTQVNLKPDLTSEQHLSTPIFTPFLDFYQKVGFEPILTHENIQQLKTCHFS